MNYIASLSGGKDSLAMVLRLINERKPMTHCIMYDTGMEYQAIHNVVDMLKPFLEWYNCELVVLKPDTYFLDDMLIRTVSKGKPDEHYGYDWCGGTTRWRTKHKIYAINKYLKTLEPYVQYIGIAADEPERIKYEANKQYPLVEWGMTEADCLKYCYDHGFNWNENGVELYDILDRVSCWCCSNKNLKELKNMYLYLPDYWTKLKALQSRIDRPFKNTGEAILTLEERFRQEEAQLTIFDFIEERHEERWQNKESALIRNIQ